MDDKEEDAPKGRGDQHHYLSKPSVVYKTQGDVSAEVGVTTLSEVSNLRSDNSQYSECTVGWAEKRFLSSLSIGTPYTPGK